MTTLIHPDQLVPGSRVGPWRVLESLGAGGFGRVFKVDSEEQPGQPYALKVALRPVSQHAPEEENVHKRLSREVAIHMAYETGMEIHSVGYWPTPEGYLYFVTNYVEGVTFHEWRWRTEPSAARLLDVYTEVVRQVAALHRRGMSHRDLKGDNILIRTADEKPFLMDYGVARLPGGATLTVGVPPTSPHLLPPESLEFLQEETWKQGARFDPGVAGDLYALGLLLYEALADSYAFDPKLPYEALMVVIMAKTPVAPHLLNPKAPQALSDIAMRLLEKRPAARYPSAEALLQALWAAGKERKQTEWQVPLTLPPPPDEKPGQVEVPRPPELPLPAVENPPQADREPAQEVRAEEQAVVAAEPPPPAAEPLAAGAAPAVAPRGVRGRWLLRGFGGLLVLFLALWVGLSTLAPTFEKGSSSVPTSAPHAPEAPRSSLSRLLAAALCSVAGLGCPAAQVRPEPAQCPYEAQKTMFEVLKVNPAKFLHVVVDIHQPGERNQLGTYRDGPVVSRVVDDDAYFADPAFPDDTLLYGRLWTGLVDEYGKPAVMVRYSEVKLPDGRTYPVCIVLGERDGRVRMEPGSKAGAAVLRRQDIATVVQFWP